MKKLFLSGKQVGEINHSVFFTKRGDQHFFRKFNGFGISLSVLDCLLENNVTQIEFDYSGQRGSVGYRIGLTSFISKSEVWQNVLNGGLEPQYVCSVDYMTKAFETLSAVGLKTS